MILNGRSRLVAMRSCRTNKLAMCTSRAGGMARNSWNYPLGAMTLAPRLDLRSTGAGAMAASLNAHAVATGSPREPGKRSAAGCVQASQNGRRHAVAVLRNEPGGPLAFAPHAGVDRGGAAKPAARAKGPLLRQQRHGRCGKQERRKHHDDSRLEKSPARDFYAFTPQRNQPEHGG